MEHNNENIEVTKNLPCPSVNVTHHYMKCGRAPVQNVTECVDMALVHIEEGIGGELC